MATEMRVGQGFDIHRFDDGSTAGRVLVLGGVTFPGERALAGHSDADVVAHAVADAVLGAAGLGDIGMHYPDTDPAWKGADSLHILADAAGKVRAAGWSIANADCSVVCESPKIASAREQMVSNLSGALGAPVSVKGRRAEGLGAIGRSEGIMCLATALLTREN
ncbi:MAG: 2-C-methyl-D-erythritol 2,4-cyclodiphosphate synthase [Acidimicrobiales bacterium]